MNALSHAGFVGWLIREGRHRYHDHHPFNQLMHKGQLTKEQLQQWVLNRYYYQTRIPIKDALILSKSDDVGFRRIWRHRIQDHDGDQQGQGGLASWLELARGVGLDVEEVQSCRSVLPGVRAAADAYVDFVREHSLLEAVASSLTELFAPNLMAARIEAWTRHYPWVRLDALQYFQTRIARAKIDCDQAIEFVVQHAVTYDLQERCVTALLKKADMLWALLDSIYSSYVSAAEPHDETHDQHGSPTATQS
jgi:pyrroloquinoline-quinone synthase